MESRITLTEWRRHVAELALLDVARATGLTQSRAAALETRPGTATVHALRAYVLACGGRLRLVVTTADGTDRELAL
jgi:hypothetical protein